MNYGPLIFLAAFFALASSWFGLVLSPQLQVGRMEQTNTLSTGASYPVARAGMARQGLDVYRENGCAYCHSQQMVPSCPTCWLWGRRAPFARSFSVKSAPTRAKLSRR